MHAKHINQTDGEWFSRGEGAFLARKPCVVPSPPVVERIRLDVEDCVNHLRVRAAWVAIPEEFLGRENTWPTLLHSPEPRPGFVAVTVKQEVTGSCYCWFQTNRTSAMTRAEVVEARPANPIEVLFAVAPSHEHRMFRRRNRTLDSTSVSLRDWTLNCCSAANLVRTVNLKVVVTALLARRSPVAYMTDNFIHKSRKVLQADRFTICAGFQCKSTKTWKDFVKSLKAGRSVESAGVKNVGTFRPADCIAVGVHLQQVSQPIHL